MKIIAPRKAVPIALCLTITLAMVPHVQAKLMSITLAELSSEAQIIVIGSVQTTAPQNLVTLRSERVIKGPRVVNVVFCRGNGSPETYELAELRDRVLIFGKLDGNCYTPIHGISSVVRFKGDDALTVAIADQPHKQSVESLVAKISSLVSRPATPK